MAATHTCGMAWCTALDRPVEVSQIVSSNRHVMTVSTSSRPVMGKIENLPAELLQDRRSPASWLVACLVCHKCWKRAFPYCCNIAAMESMPALHAYKNCDSILEEYSGLHNNASLQYMRTSGDPHCHLDNLSLPLSAYAKLWRRSVEGPKLILFHPSHYQRSVVLFTKYCRSMIKFQLSISHLPCLLQVTSPKLDYIMILDHSYAISNSWCLRALI